MSIASYSLAKARWLQNEPASWSQFDRVMEGLGLELDGTVWKTEDAEGACLVQLMPKFVFLNFVPSHAEKVADVLMEKLRTMAKATLAGPAEIRFEMKPDGPHVMGNGRLATAKELVTVTLAGDHEDTQCSIRYANATTARSGPTARAGPWPPWGLPRAGAGDLPTGLCIGGRLDQTRCFRRGA